MSNDLWFFVTIGGTILILTLCAMRLRRRFPRLPQSGVKISPHTGGAYADFDEVLQSELDRIRLKKPCLDKNHW